MFWVHLDPFFMVRREAWFARCLLMWKSFSNSVSKFEWLIAEVMWLEHPAPRHSLCLSSLSLHFPSPGPGQENSRCREFQVAGRSGDWKQGSPSLGVARAEHDGPWHLGNTGGGEPDSSYYYYGYLGKDAACWRCSACRTWWAGLWQEATEHNNFSQYFMRLKLTMAGWGQV